MVKKSPKNNIANDKSGINKKRLWLIKSPWWVKLLIVFLILVLVSIANAAYQQWQLEKKFKRVDTDVGAVVNVIEKEQPDISIEKERYCDKTNEKYSEGELFCHTVFASKNKNGDSPETVTLTESVRTRTIIDNPGLFTKERTLGTTTIYIHSSGLKCRLDMNEHVIGAGNYTFRFSCSEKSKRAFYPYRD